MVQGLEKFKEYFKEYTNYYVFIGGTACQILMDDIGSSFRATKDFDIVLIIEAIDVSFGKIFWKFIKDGGYEYCEKDSNNHQFYRFSKPKDSSFPSIIELFSKIPHYFERNSSFKLTSIHIDESIVSLSAILLDDEYYELLVNGKTLIDGYSVINIETVILFKIRAWLDYKLQKENEVEVDSRKINKHKNDIFRLLVNVVPMRRLELSTKIQNDVSSFIEKVKDDKPDLKNLGIMTNFDRLVQLLQSMFLG